MIRPSARTRLVSTLAAAALLGSSGPASPASWPTPALGPSASGDPELLLTFDDGPEPGTTDQVLATLAKHKVRAIFFVVGRRLSGKMEERGRAMVDKILAAGHLTGNHTVDHVHLCQGSGEKAAFQLDEARRQIEEASGLPAVLFRAPYGNRCKRLEAQLAERRVDHMHWDIDPQEWKGHDAKKVEAYVTARLERLQGRAVLLMHDIHGVTARALPGILEWIDEENARRAEKGERPIRILDPSDVVLEKLAPDTLPLLRDLAAGARRFAPELVEQTVAPVAPPAVPDHTAGL